MSFFQAAPQAPLPISTATPPAVPPTFAQASADILALWPNRPMMRVVNYHNSPKARSAHYDAELAQYAKSFSSVTEAELFAYLHTGRWDKSKPGMIPVSYEGYRESFDVLAPLFEKHGFIGYWFIITDFIKTPVANQLQYALTHRIGMQSREYPDGRYALSWDEIRALDKKHVICSHARNHIELSKQTAEVQQTEILGSQEDFQSNLGHPVHGFASLRGPAHREFALQDRLLEQAGYKFVFSNYKIQRVGMAERHG